MKHLSIETQNLKGNELKYKKNLGFVSVSLKHLEDKIVVDDFQGSGGSYKQREMTEIRIYNNGELIFKGDKYDLFEQLRKI